MKSIVETKNDHKQLNHERMKTLRKLEIKPERLMKDEELITLRGGYDNYSCCICYSGMTPKGYMAALNSAECQYNCGEMGWTGSWGSGGMGNC